MEYLNMFLWTLIAAFFLGTRASDEIKESPNDDFDMVAGINKTSEGIYDHVEKSHTVENGNILQVVQSSLEPRIKMFMDRELVTSFNYTLTCQDITSNYELTVTSANLKVLRIPETSISISCANATLIDGNTTSHTETANLSYAIDGSFDVKLLSGLIGYDKIKFQLAEESDVNETRTEETDTYDVVVIRKMRPVDRIFRIAVYCVQIFTLVGFGSKLDLKVVKECLRRPIAPAIGFCCQYLMMPLVACAIGKTVTDETTVSLGIFVAGCCPGGGQSNMYSYLLKGDLDLSITMTTISTVAALAMLPAWIYSLGRLFVGDQNLVIPFSNVVIALAILIVPLCFGVFLKAKFPICAKRLQKVLKPVILFFAVILLVVGIYSNLFIFSLFKPRVILAGCLLPYIGYTVGGIVAAVLRQPWPRVKTIALETGMQNTSIAYILLITSFEAPKGDLASVASIASAVMTPLPPLLVTIVYLIYQKCKKKYEPVSQNGDEMVKNGKKKDVKNGAVDGNVKEPIDGEEVEEKLTAV